MEITKRVYQEECVNSIVKYLSTKKKQNPSLVIAPVAAGKSLLIAWSIEKSDDKVLILQPSSELLEQNYNKLISLGVEAKIYSASKKSKQIGHITFATIGSIINKLDEFIEAGIKKIIIDECHLYSWKKSDDDSKKDGMLRKVVNTLGATHVIGFTASPIILRTYGSFGDNYSQLNFITRNLPKLFTDVLYHIPISEMVNNGFWKKIEYKCFDRKNSFLKLNTNGSEYTEKSMLNWYIQNKIQEDILKCIEVCLKNGKKSILVFLPSVNFCKELAKITPNSAAVYGDMPKEERDYVIENFKLGNISVVFNMEVLTTGFDFPSLDTIILSRPTNSLAKYYQMIGRITRLYDVVGTVIDLVGIVKKFGKVEELNFENVEGYGWGMFSGDRLLTGIRLDDDRHVTKQMIFKPTVEKINGKKQQVFKFGKYQYTPLKDIPKDYLKWSLLNIDFKKEEKLKKEILNIINS